MNAQFPEELEYGAESSGNPIPAFLLDPRGVIKRRWPWMLVALILGLALVWWAYGLTSSR